MSGAGAFALSTLAEAQTNPASSRRSRAAAGCGRPALGLAQDDLQLPRIAVAARGEPDALPPTARRRRARTTRPSAFETTFWAMQDDVAVAKLDRTAATSAARSSPASTSACSTGKTSSLTGRARARNLERGLRERRRRPHRASASASSSARTPARPRPPAAFGLVDHERVDQPLVPRATSAGAVPPPSRREHRSAGPLTARPPISGLTATGRRRRAARERPGSRAPPESARCATYGLLGASTI